MVSREVLTSRLGLVSVRKTLVSLMVTDWDIFFFFAETGENVFLRISILNFRGQHPRIDSYAKLTLKNFFVKLSQKLFLQRLMHSPGH